jgi:hypothetical protein
MSMLAMTSFCLRLLFGLWWCVSVMMPVLVVVFVSLFWMMLVFCRVYGVSAPTTSWRCLYEPNVCQLLQLPIYQFLWLL